MSSRNVLIVLLAMVAGGIYYKFFHVPSLLKAETENALQSFSEAVATHDRAKVGQVLGERLDAPVKIHLEVTWLSLTHKGSAPVKEDFDKSSFLTFVDNILYSLESFSYEPQLEAFHLSSDRASADVVFTSKEWGDGKSFYGGISVMMRFSSDTRCEGKVVFKGGRALLQEANCSMSLRAVPKPEEAYKLQQSPEAMQQFLMR
ncbi:MAG: hypothetical protein EBV03_08010 [Proteobacteria bacterium]|nr:hypothetical protein [Pseudomonadota bacterium]